MTFSGAGSDVKGLRESDAEQGISFLGGKEKLSKASWVKSKTEFVFEGYLHDRVGVRNHFN